MVQDIDLTIPQSGICADAPDYAVCRLVVRMKNRQTMPVLDKVIDRRHHATLSLVDTHHQDTIFLSFAPMVTPFPS
ncbi:hypothetical protein NEUTE1DRAFT_101846 [Neurospora tetrasperma FGSC 2508]|uniref:Uncharacterized protein n=1 Tax=Neurospora tetrasperma (strain FGSC 2508 / ATCC MYA-4615 / P0657) TaxID=510951 RepID=F8MQD8_NEUT8|nr:uncharacterized protein NEUTE1DRAFT_101846 [Neurospora tetrasperma FGSC 2508]EGO56568.1 hypothetical protein NEUTE1DRAFT_101846 [Neurospora tetrasperma FGSC 2508]EGZ70564.1 hypothetical protein NEUTE2DRAFT_130563 [Neurospora tetrasperma FGSC 2509]